MKFTKEQQQEYVAKDRNHCPFCGKRPIGGDTNDIGAWADILSLKMTCQSCKQSWQEEYSFKRIAPEKTIAELLDEAVLFAEDLGNKVKMEKEIQIIREKYEKKGKD